MVSPGDIWITKISFSNKTGQYKNRPVLVLYVKGEDAVIAEITSVPPKKTPGYYDFAKEKIRGWKTYGLNEPSFVKCKNLHTVNISLLHKLIGKMHVSEFEKIESFILKHNKPKEINVRKINRNIKFIDTDLDR